MNYSKFQVEDFVADEYFIKWVKRPDQESNAFWNAWLSKNRDCHERVREARQIILQLDFEPNLPPEGRFLEVWDKIIKSDSVQENFQYQISAHQTTPLHRRWLYSIAAAVAIFMIAFLAVILYDTRTVEITTAYGESRTLSLPDSTRVTLNSNSKITFSPEDFSAGKREVFLTGEAFFSVVHKRNHENFIVHTNELNVEVLGTKFNVNSRRGNTKVILKEGKVKLNIHESAKENVVMAPGEYVEFRPKGELTHKTVDANDYLEWRNNRLIFVRTSLMEIGQLLEDNYGYTVVFEDAALKKRKFTGSSSTVEIEELLEKLSRLYNLDVQRSGNKITLKYKQAVLPEKE